MWMALVNYARLCTLVPGTCTCICLASSAKVKFSCDVMGKKWCSHDKINIVLEIFSMFEKYHKTNLMWKHENSSETLREALFTQRNKTKVLWEILSIFEKYHKTNLSVKGHQCLKMSYIPWEFFSNIERFCQNSHEKAHEKAVIL